MSQRGEPHPMTLTREHTALVVCDVQERLFPVMDADHREEVMRNVKVLATSARRLGVPTLVTEQYPKGLGRTLPELASVLPEGVAPIEKTTFSCGGDEGFRAAVTGLRREQWVLCGIEAHVCVYQTALDLLRDGRQVVLAADAVSSRRPRDRDLALGRMRDLGVQVMSMEMVLFEILRQAGTPDFRAVAGILKE
jgi:nicotinamidase-related amidase